MKTVYIDESGDLGEKGNRYFVIALLAPTNVKRIRNIMKRFCAKELLQEIKAAQLPFSQKVTIFNKICAANDYTISYIVLDKRNLRNEKLFADKNLIYNYLFSLLIRKTIRSTKEDLCILLDNHSVKVKSINSLADYVRLKALTDWEYTHDLHISFIDSKHSKLIQAADLIANSIYAKYTYNTKHLYNMLTISESNTFPQNDFGK